MTDSNQTDSENNLMRVPADSIIQMYTSTLYQVTAIILYMRPANERRRYNVTSSLIGWAHAQYNP